MVDIINPNKDKLTERVEQLEKAFSTMAQREDQLRRSYMLLADTLFGVLEGVVNELTPDYPLTDRLKDYDTIKNHEEKQ